MRRKKLFPRQWFQCPEHFLLAYDFEHATWVWDVKFYARDGGWWTAPNAGVRVGEINEEQFALMQKYQSDVDETLQKYIESVKPKRP